MPNEQQILREALEVVERERLESPPHSPEDDDIAFLTKDALREIIRQAMGAARREALRGN